MRVSRAVRASALRLFAVGALLTTESVIAQTVDDTEVDNNRPPIVRLLENRTYFNPYGAEVRGGKTDVLGMAWGKSVPYQQRSGSQLMWDIAVGVEIPVVIVETSNSAGGSYPAGHAGIGFWIPVDFHLLLALQDKSSPPLDTDYRFGMIIKGHITLCDACLRPMGSDHIGLEVRVQPWTHESTHLGDEFALAAVRNHPAEFQRINVSYNSWDIALSVSARGSGNQLRIGAGVNHLWPGQTYYQADSLEIGDRPVTPPTNRSEPYAVIEWRRVVGGPYISIESRHRSVFDYDRSEGMPEDRRHSYNIIMGWYSPRQSATALGKVSPYLRFYHGVNPFGQFRSVRNYQIVGLGLRIEP